MANKDNKPKPASQVKRNPNRKNGKAFKTKVGLGLNNHQGGAYGYSEGGLVKLAQRKGMSVQLVIEDLKEKAIVKKERKKNGILASAFRKFDGKPPTSYKMDTVDRHFDKVRPFPCVGRKAGASEVKTKTKPKAKAKTVRFGGAELAAAARELPKQRAGGQVMEVQAALKLATHSSN